jgi:hypothetical protein
LLTPTYMYDEISVKRLYPDVIEDKILAQYFSDPTENGKLPD